MTNGNETEVQCGNKVQDVAKRCGAHCGSLLRRLQLFVVLLVTEQLTHWRWNSY